MVIENLHYFLRDYFYYHHCKLVQNSKGKLTVQLTEDMDKALMNRPFYWHYIKNMGTKGTPMQLTLITDPKERDGKNEWIHFGSPRLQQIITHLKETERFTHLFQMVETTIQVPLYPWLVVNMRICYQGKQKKTEIVSVGLHLVNGTIRTNMMAYLEAFHLQMTIPDYCYTISPLIKLKSGYRRIEKMLEDYIYTQTHEWARASRKVLEEEINLINHFYQHIDKNEETVEQIEKETMEIMERYDPSIRFDVINGGLFYLTNDK